jgi:hypothetical protein
VARIHKPYLRLLEIKRISFCRHAPFLQVLDGGGSPNIGPNNMRAIATDYWVGAARVGLRLIAADEGKYFMRMP